MQLAVKIFGAWRSLVAHRNGVAVVGGSNPLAPTMITQTTFIGGVADGGSNPFTPTMPLSFL